MAANVKRKKPTPFIPSPEEIKRRCREIQNSWSKRVELSRRSTRDTDQGWNPTKVRDLSR